MEKRNAERKIRRLPVTFSDGQQDYSGTSSDFSRTGLFIRTRKPLNPGTSIKIIVEVDNNRKMTFSGVVVRSIKTGLSDFKNGMGVRFTSIPDEYDTFITALLK